MISNMKAVVMAGGEGSRLRPLTIGRPKPLVPVVNQSVMAHILDLLASHDITDVIVTLRYRAEDIENRFEDGSSRGMKLTYVVEETPLGTAGSVKNAAHLLDDTFLVISGDSLTDFNLQEILAAHKAKDALASLTLTRVENPREYGVTIVDGEGRLVKFQEKPSWSEIISDTVNTGIYVLEPDVFDMIPKDTMYDFSTELFPKLLAQDLPIFGHVAEGYWCDIGTIEEYMKASADLLSGKVKLTKPLGEHIGGDIWVGHGVEIASDAQLYGPIYLGHEVKIKGGIVINGPSAIRDYSVIDNYNRIDHSIIWRNCYVGESSELRGSIISRQCSIKSHVSVFEGVVVGENCVLGEGCVLHPDVKLWTHKEVDPGTTVKESIIWGNQGRRSLFNQHGVSGVVNVDLTPEFTAKLGAALGAVLSKGSYVAVNRDSHRASRMIKRALVSGLPGTGANVWDVGTIAIPIIRHFVRSHDSISAGIHVRLSPFDQRVVDIRFMDDQGVNQSRSTERSLERSFFREDFRRVYLDEIGTIAYAQDPVAGYTQDFLNHINVERIQQANLRLVADVSHGSAGEPLESILTQLGVEAVFLNGRTDESKLAMLEEQFQANRRQMAKIVVALETDFGVQLDVGGEKIFIVDEQGQALDNITATALMIELALFAHPGSQVAVPVTLPNALDAIAKRYDSSLIRVRHDMHSIMSAARADNVLIAADGRGNFIFPSFQPAVDGMMAVACLLKYLAIRQMKLSQIVAELPQMHLNRRRVQCPWQDKGKIMRLLNEWCARPEMEYCHIEHIDGIKIHFDEHEWVHLAPQPDAPQFRVIAEAGNMERAQVLAEQYSQLIEGCL